MLVFQSVSGSPAASTGTDAKSGPVKADTHTAALRSSGDGRSASLKQDDVKPFSMLGVTWTDPGARALGTVKVRDPRCGVRTVVDVAAAGR